MDSGEQQSEPPQQQAENAATPALEDADQQPNGHFQEQPELVAQPSDDTLDNVAAGEGDSSLPPDPLAPPSQEAEVHVEPPPPSSTPDPAQSSGQQQQPQPQTKSANYKFQLDNQTNETKQHKKDDDKNGIYKALAIKLKKELVKTREEFQKLRKESSEEISNLKSQLASLEESYNSERLHYTSTNATLEANNKSLKAQLDSSENDLHSIQIEFENYKLRATQIMQQQNNVQSITNKTFEEDRYNQLKALNLEQKERISRLEAQLKTSFEKSKELELECKTLGEQLNVAQNQLESYKTVDNKCACLTRENETLKFALKQYRDRLKDPKSCDISAAGLCYQIKPEQQSPTTTTTTSNGDESESSKKKSNSRRDDVGAASSSKQVNEQPYSSDPQQPVEDVAPSSPPPSTSATPTRIDAPQTDSSSSFDGSTSGGYVHIKPATFEIIRSSSALEDAQKHIDTLTKVYLDSESMNSLLSEQVKALKEEIRRIQRGTERMDLAENLEYLKNIVFRFISLESNQTEQRKRLVPVLSAVLKLSPDETAKLNSLAIAEKSSLTSSFFKL